MKSFIHTSSILLALLAAGCETGTPGTAGDPGGDDPGDSNDGGDPGDPGDPGDLGEPAACGLEGDVTIGAGTAGGLTDADGVFYFAEFETRGAVSALEIGLWQGFGEFAEGIAPGTYDLAGSTAEDCGACVMIFDQLSEEGAAHILYASSGTLEVTEVSTEAGSRFAGVASDLSFVEIDAETGAEVPGGCTASVGSHAFEVTLEAGETM